MSQNQGTVLASAVDAEMNKFRSMQEDIKKLQNDLSIVLSQETENEMVKAELDLLTTSNEDAKVYKLLGPALIPQELDDARQTVQKRLEFIRGEKERLEAKMTKIQDEGEALANKINQMQSNLQQTTAEAVRAVAAQHGGK